MLKAESKSRSKLSEQTLFIVKPDGVEDNLLERLLPDLSAEALLY